MAQLHHLRHLPEQTPQSSRGHYTKVSFAYARSDQNVSVNLSPALIIRQPVKIERVGHSDGDRHTSV